MIWIDCLHHDPLADYFMIVFLPDRTNILVGNMIGDVYIYNVHSGTHRFEGLSKTYAILDRAMTRDVSNIECGKVRYTKEFRSHLCLDGAITL